MNRLQAKDSDQLIHNELAARKTPNTSNTATARLVRSWGADYTNGSGFTC